MDLSDSNALSSDRATHSFDNTRLGSLLVPRSPRIRYYPIHISSPDWNVTGLTFSGVPGFPHFGHNAHVGWGITHGMAGKEDLYLEKIEGGGETWVGVDGPKPLKKVVQVLKVRGGKDVQLEILSTENGPLLTAPVPSRDGTHFAISIKNTSTFRPNSQLACHYALLRATSVKEALDSMKGWVEPAGNFTVADKESIGYVNRGCYPLRNPANHWLPVPGWLDEYKWRGEIPFEELPRIEKPASGKIIHANNPIVGRGYKHGLLSIDYSMTWRVDQIRGTIEERLEGGKWGVEDTRMLHSDVYSRPAEVLCGLIGEVEGVAETWRQKMQVWDFRLNKESVEAYVYQVWRRRLVASLFEAGEKLAPVLEGSNGFDVNSKLTKESVVENGNIWNSIVFLAEQNDTCVLGAGETWNDRATRTFQQTIDMLSAEHGSNWPTWGDVHVLQAKHPLTGKIDGFLGSGALDGRRVGMGGDGDTVQGSFDRSLRFIDLPTPFSLFTAAPGYTSVLALSVCRYALTPSNWNESKWIIPFGVSGHRASPHFEDQLAYYEKHEMVDWVYDWEGLERGAGGRWEFVPAG